MAQPDHELIAIERELGVIAGSKVTGPIAWPISSFDDDGGTPVSCVPYSC